MTTKTLAVCKECNGSGENKGIHGKVISSCISCRGSGTLGVFSKKADKTKRKDEIWSDTNLNNKFINREFERLKCNCGSISFEVLQTGSYETTAKCHECKAYYVVHNG